ISTCTDFTAMAHANTEFNHGYIATSVSLMLCTRHSFVLLNGVGNLQKSERYCNMSFIFIAALVLFGKCSPIVLFYDIACQWKCRIHKHLASAKFLAHLCIEFPKDNNLCFLIPKYHFWGHTGKNHSQYSFNLVSDVSHTDSKEIECNW
ncbi:uncharacterized protein PHACADRAFT_97589, partial [Phanerochaete carnosa HHB-10118-sp]